MKHGIYEITFMGKPLYEVYVWIGNRKLGYVETFATKAQAIQCFNGATYTYDMIAVPGRLSIESGR